VWHRIRVEKSFAFGEADKGGAARGHFNPRGARRGAASAISNIDGDDRGRLAEKCSLWDYLSKSFLPANSRTGRKYLTTVADTYVMPS